jgi:hypothetical protein
MPYWEYTWSNVSLLIQSDKEEGVTTFGDSAGKQSLDYSGGTNNVKHTNEVRTPFGGSSIKFSGGVSGADDNYLRIANPNDGNLGFGGTHICIEFFVKTSLTPDTSEGAIIVQKREDDQDLYPYFEIKMTQQGLIHVEFFDGGQGGNTISSTSTTLVNDDKWHYVVAELTRTNVGSSGVNLSLYLDGSFEGGIHNNASFGTNSFDGSLVIGDDQISTGSNARDDFEGYINGFRITSHNRYNSTFDLTDVISGPLPEDSTDTHWSDVKVLIQSDRQSDGTFPTDSSSNAYTIERPSNGPIVTEEAADPFRVGYNHPDQLINSINLNTDADWNKVVLACPFNTNFDDKSNSGHTLTAGSSASGGNATTVITEKKFGLGSLYLDGDDWVDVAASTHSDFHFGTGDFTIEAWIKTSTLSPQVIIAKTNANDYNYGWMFRVDTSSSGGDIEFIGKGSANTTDISVSSSPSLGGSGAAVYDGNWHHVAVTRNDTSLKLWVDGVQAGSETITSGFDFNEYGANGGAVQIGRLYYTEPTYQYFNGHIDDLRVTKGVGRAITLPKRGHTEQGAIKFDGSGDFIEVDHNSDGSLDFGSGYFTIAFWMYIENWPASYRGTMISQGDGADGYRSFEIYLSTNATMTASVVTSTGSELQLHSGSGIIKKRRWTHVALTRNKSDMRFYINGVEVDDGSFSGDVYYNDRPTIIGGRWLNGSLQPPDTSGSYEYEGYLYDVMIAKNVSLFDGFKGSGGTDESANVPQGKLPDGDLL